MDFIGLCCVVQHELSRALATVLKSNVKLASLGLVLGVEVRNREFTAMDAKTSQAMLAAAQQSHGQHKSLQSQQKSADEPLDGSWTEMPASQEQPAAKQPLDPYAMDLLAELLGSNTLQDRRLDMSVGPYGFELLSSGSKKEVVEHAARSILYADMHDLQVVFAVHVKVRRALRKRPRFPPWPDLGDAAKRVNPFNVLRIWSSPMLAFFAHAATCQQNALALTKFWNKYLQLAATIIASHVPGDPHKCPDRRGIWRSAHHVPGHVRGEAHSFARGGGHAERA